MRSRKNTYFSEATEKNSYASSNKTQITKQRNWKSLKKEDTKQKYGRRPGLGWKASRVLLSLPAIGKKMQVHVLEATKAEFS